MNFLTARWEHLLLANFAVHPNLLQPWVPAGTRLDQFEGKSYISLVAFMFRRTRVLGVPIPFHTTFPEVNLRFYISPIDQPERRAVTFIQEIVPSRAIPLVANWLFGENYVAMNMGYHPEQDLHRYTWTDAAKHSFTARIDSNLALPQAGSLEAFITEHYWGYSKFRKRTLEYQVQHPPWRCCTLDEYDLSLDFGKIYGDAFAFLSEATPTCVQYAEGSEVSVSFPSRLATEK